MKSWDAALLDLQHQASLVTIARDRRLVLEDRDGRRWVDLCWVDEVALALIDLSLSQGRTLDIVYPAPAGQVAVLLAAQLLVHQFVRKVRSPSVGIVTADTTMAARTWEALRIGSEPIARVFPSFRAGPDGLSPWATGPHKGVIIGQKAAGWPVDYLIVDHLAGYVDTKPVPGAIEVFADPLDRNLRRAEERGRLIWGWSDADLALWDSLEARRDHTVPFSVASDRLQTMASGVDVTVLVQRHDAAEAALARVRDDLRQLRSLSPGRTDRNLERGLSVAWHHLTALISLPCRPSQFDRFAGVPPIAARSTRTFAQEIMSWANTLNGEAHDLASSLASDIGDLRASLDDANPFEQALRDFALSADRTLFVTRTKTASRALLEMLGLEPDSAHGLTVCALGRLHREGTWPLALMVGEPSPWDWHQLLSGIAPQLHVLALGEKSASACATAVAEVRTARDHWGDAKTRASTWRALLGSEPPRVPSPTNRPSHTVIVVEGSRYEPQADPFESLASLFDLDPLDISGEGPAAGLVREGEAGDWTAKVPAVQVTTDHGRIFLDVEATIEVRVGDHIVDKRPDALQAGDVLLVGRQQGRVGLIEALEERLAHRPDLLAARLLVDAYRSRVRRRFVESGMTVFDVYHALRAGGCDKDPLTMKNWIIGTTMAPQQFDDLRRLNQALGLEMSSVELRELFRGVQRRRGFRRSAGRALAAAAREATVVDDAARVDGGTGLSVADLRDAVIQAEVVSVSPSASLVPFTLLRRMEST